MALKINLDPGDQIERLIFVKDISEYYIGTAAFVNDVKSNRFFVISGVDSTFDHTGPEIMVFEANVNEEIINWGELAVWRDERDLTDCMRDFSIILYLFEDYGNDH